ncbi:MAG: alpha/beta hydrolase [Rhodospirillales bacterium]
MGKSLMPIPDLQAIDLPGGAISYREAGNGPPLMLLHGINIHSGIWMHQFEHFAEQYRVIAWDAPSYGSSAPRLTESDTDVGLYASALKDFLDALGVEKVIMLGHSLGGVIATRFAGDHPERLAALVLSCTHPGAAKPKGEPLHEKYQQRIAERTQYDPLEYGRLQATKMTTGDTPPDLIEKIATIVAETCATHFPLNARMSQEADNRAGLANYTGPVLIINGGRDRLGPSDGHKRLIAALPHAHRIVFDHLGHSPYLEDPQTYNESLDEFFAMPS